MDDEAHSSSLLVEFSKDTPVQRTRVTITSDEILTGSVVEIPISSTTDIRTDTIFDSRGDFKIGTRTATGTDSKTFIIDTRLDSKTESRTQTQASTSASSNREHTKHTTRTRPSTTPPRSLPHITSTKPVTNVTRPSHAPSSTPLANVTVPAHSGSKGLPKDGIAAVVVGTVAGLALIAALIWFIARKLKKSKDEDDKPPSPPPVRSFRVLNQPPTPSFRVLNQPPAHQPDHNPDISSSLPPPIPLEDSARWSAPGRPPESRSTSWGGLSSPTPKPAIAEAKSFTRTWGKPRMYNVGERGLAELPATESFRGETSEQPPFPEGEAALGRPEIISPLSPAPPQGGMASTWGQYDGRGWERRYESWGSTW